MTVIRPDGFPYTQQAISPSLPRGSASTKTGTPVAAARAFPSGSVRIATAPADNASAQNAAAPAQSAAPCTRLPGRATYKSPAATARESRVTPLTNPRSFGEIELPTEASRTPSSEPRTDSGLGCWRAGRIATG